MLNRKTTESLNKKIMPFILGITAAVTCILMNASVTYAHHDDNELIKTVYHVKVDGKDIGTVRERSIVDKAVNDYIEKAKGKNGDYLFNINENIELVPDRMFRPTFDNETAIKNLMQNLSVSMEAYKLVVGNQTVAYVSSEKEAEDVLLKMKLEHVPQADIERIEKAKNEQKEPEIPELKPGQSQIINVDFSTPVYIRKAEVSVNSLMTVDEAIDRIKDGSVRKEEHIVKEGETIDSIADQYHLSMDQFFTLNPRLILSSIIKDGDKVTVQVKEPFTEVVVYEATRAQEVIPFTVEKREDSTMEKGETKTLQKGQKGLDDITYTLRKADGKVIEKNVIDQKRVKDPVTEVLAIGTKIIPSKGTGKFAWPTVGGYVSSHKGMRWGRMHKGMDIARPSNKSILAADNGTVESAGWDGDYGNKIVINHHNGIKTIYAHMSSLSVSRGQVVQKGQKIGVMGATGDVTGVHLHFEVYENGVLKNPEDYL